MPTFVGIWPESERNGMTEMEWRACSDPGLMLEFTLTTVSDRKLRLLTCACCRRAWDLIERERSQWATRFRKAIITAELFADQRIREEELEEPRGAVWMDQWEELPENPALSEEDTVETMVEKVVAHARLYAVEKEMAYAASCAVASDDQLRSYAARAVFISMARVKSCAWEESTTIRLSQEHQSICTEAIRVAEGGEQAALLRHLIGNPFYPFMPPSSWPSNITALAHALYNAEDCHYALADALMESGHVELAEHFQEPGHPKGCWAMDIILGKQ